MKYFLLSLQKAYTDVPSVKNWYKKINPRWINIDEGYRLPKRELFFIGSQDRVVYTDILMNPFFLMSPMVHDVTLMYDPCIDMKEIVLLDAERHESKLYFLPILEEIECTETMSQQLLRGYTADVMLEYSQVKDKPIFILRGKQNRHIIVNLEFVESILKRGATGIGLQEIACRLR